MIVDHRTYTVRPGMVKTWIANYEKYALPVQKKHLGNLLGFFVSEIGPLSQIVFMWGYEDYADRERRRAAMEADPDYQIFFEKAREVSALVAQENKILRPTSFSPIR